LRLGRRRRRSRGRSARRDRATLGARSAGLRPQPAIERSYRGRQPDRREAPKNRTWFPQLTELSPPATSQPWCEMANSIHHQDTRPPTPQDRVEPLYLWHYPLIRLLAAPAASVALSVTLAAVMWYSVERPVLRSAAVPASRPLPSPRQVGARRITKSSSS